MDLKQKIPDLFSENVLTVHTSEGRVFHSSLWILVICEGCEDICTSQIVICEGCSDIFGVKLLFVGVAAIFS